MGIITPQQLKVLDIRFKITITLHGDKIGLFNSRLMYVSIYFSTWTAKLQFTVRFDIRIIFKNNCLVVFSLPLRSPSHLFLHFVELLLSDDRLVGI